MNPRAKVWVCLGLLAAAAGAEVGCPVFPLTAGGDAPGGSFVPVAPKGSILLSIDNQSGLPAVVDAIYFVAGQQVRNTTRLMSVDGVESTAKVFRTTADEVQVTARIANPVSESSASKYLGGFMLAQGRYIRGVDYDDQGSVDFVIPPPPPDCNGNGVPDVSEIADGTKRDCDGNTVPDECEPGSPTILQCAGDLIISADASGRGQMPDLTQLLSVIDSCTPAANIAMIQNVAPGTELAIGGPTTVTLTIVDGDGNTAQCASHVTMIDDSPPIIECPGTIMLVGDETCRAAVPDLAGLISVFDNTTPIDEMAKAQDVSIGKMIAAGLTLVNFQATDAYGNTSVCQVTLDVRDDPRLPASDCSSGPPRPRH